MIQTTSGAVKIVSKTKHSKRKCTNVQNENDATRRKWLRRVAQLVIFAACSAVGVWQSAIIADMYLAYPVRIDIRIQRPEQLELPAISVCFVPFDDAGNGTEAKAEVKSRLTVKQWFQVTPNVDDIVLECSLSLPNGFEKANCSQLAPVVSYISSRHKCITWFARAFNPSASPQPIRYDLDQLIGGDWVTIRLRNLRTLQDTIGITVHSPDTMVEPDLGNPAYLEIVRFWYADASIVRASITYTTSESNLLRSPYVSECKSYKHDYGVQSQRNGIERCALKRFWRNSTRWPPDVLANDRIQIEGRTWDMPFAVGSGAARDRAACAEHYKSPDCVDINYNLALKAVEYGAADTLDILLYAPSGNEVTLFEHPRYEVIEVLSYIAGIISLWVGVSVVSIISPVIPYLLVYGRVVRARVCGGGQPNVLGDRWPRSQRLPPRVTVVPVSKYPGLLQRANAELTLTASV